MRVTIESPQEKVQQKTLDAGTFFTNGDNGPHVRVYVKTPGGAALVHGGNGSCDYFPDDEHGSDPCVVVGHLKLEH